MPSTLAQLEVRVATRLTDVSNLIWATANLDEAVRAALDEYNGVNPLTAETTITLPGASHEIALNGITGLLDVLNVWWPYATTGSEVWPPNQVRGWRLIWDDAQPLLILDSETQDQPQLNDVMRVWYTKPNTIQNLDSAAVTTLPAHHEGYLVTGASAHAAIARTIDQVETFSIIPKIPQTLQAWGKERLADYHTWLKGLRGAGVRSGRPFGAGWQMDKWDGQL